MLLFFRNETGFGGNNGFTDFKRMLGIPITAHVRVVLCVLTGLTLIGLFVMARAIVHSKYGRVLQAIRDAETRVMFTGYDPVAYKLSIWTLSAVMCAVAGALYVPQVGIINPGEMSPAAGIEMAIWAAVGGRATLIGPDRRRLLRQWREELVHGRLPRILALLPGRAVHRGDAVPAERPDRPACRKKRMTPELMKPLARRRAAAHAQKEGQRWPARFVAARTLLRQGVALYVEDITVSFDGFKALNQLSLTINVGELRCIIGPNGAGKTTMMDCITGKTRPDAGKVFFGSTSTCCD